VVTSQSGDDRGNEKSDQHHKPEGGQAVHVETFETNKKMKKLT